jgi:hypothetical protein
MSDLVRAIHKHGGFEAVARRLDLKFRYRSKGYWKNFANVEKVRSTVAALLIPVHQLFLLRTPFPQCVTVAWRGGLLCSYRAR